jgi:hypothetical protein
MPNRFAVHQSAAACCTMGRAGLEEAEHWLSAFLSL